MSSGREFPLILHFDGAKWIAQRVSPGYGGNALYAVAATGTANAFAAGFFGNSGSFSETLVYHYS